MLFASSAVHARTYKVGLVEWLPWATAFVAAEKGFWKAAGIDVEVKQFKNYDTENLKSFQFGGTDFALVMLGNAVEMIAKSPKYSIIYEHDWSHGGDIFTKTHLQFLKF